MARMRRESAQHGPRLIDRSADGARLEVAGASQWPFPRGGWDVDQRLADMDRTRVDLEVVSAVVPTFCYHLEPQLALAFAQIQNEAFAALVRAHPDRFVGLATLPMQAPELAAQELRRAVHELELRGAEIGTNVAGRNLDDPEFAPVWEAAQEVDAFVFVHPDRVAGTDRLSRYYLSNILGNPLDTSIAIASLVFGGVVERYPTLTLCFAHGGGFIPYQRGRLRRGWVVRPEAKGLRGPPEESLSRLYFDTILHSPAALGYLVGTVGSDRVLLGSDYPFDMGPDDPVADVLAVPGLDRAARDQILGDTAARLLRLSPRGASHG